MKNTNTHAEHIPGPAESAWLDAQEFDAKAMAAHAAISEQIEAVHARMRELDQRQRDAQAERDQARAEMKAAALRGEMSAPETRETEATAAAVLEELTIGREGLSEKLADLSAELQTINARVMAARSKHFDLRQNFEREVVLSALRVLVQSLPPKISTGRIAEVLGCEFSLVNFNREG